MSGEDYCKRCIHKTVCHTVAECLNSWQDDFSCNDFEPDRLTGEWIPINEETIKTLHNHYYYLVAHKYFSTPMKAKYHNDSIKHFEVFSSKSIRISPIFLESTDDISHFMELPELPKREEAAADE